MREQIKGSYPYKGQGEENEATEEMACDAALYQLIESLRRGDYKKAEEYARHAREGYKRFEASYNDLIKTFIQRGKQPPTALESIKKQIDDPRWEVGSYIDKDSRWYEARISDRNTIVVQRATADDLVRTVNSILVD